MSKKQIIIGGTGGQGIILSGLILAEAAVFDGKYVVQAQNYGPESRGGASRSDVIISDNEIHYPKVKNADIFLALSQEAYNKYKKYIKDDTIVILDENISADRGDYFKFNIIEFVYNNLKKPMVINILSLGIINGLTNIVTNDSLEKAIEKNVPRGTFEINFLAYKKGYDLAKTKEKRW